MKNNYRLWTIAFIAYTVALLVIPSRIESIEIVKDNLQIRVEMLRQQITNMVIGD